MMDMHEDMGMEMMGTTTKECRTSNTPWLQSMAYCIHKACGAAGYTVEEQARCFSNHALSGASEPSFNACLPDTAPTTELPEKATWLNVTSLVNQDLYHATHGTLEEFARSEYIHTRYSIILYLIVIGTCLAWGIKIQLASAFPGMYRKWLNSKFRSKLRQSVTLPALLGSRHLEPLPMNLGYVPGRALSISITIFVILNIIFSSISFGSFQPNIYFPSLRFELCEYVGNRTGMLSLVNISISILFAGRNNILIAITGWSQTTFLTLHRWAARVATLQAIVHSAVYTLQYVDPGYEGAASYAKKAAEPFYWWGIIGTIALSLATALAVLPLRIALYELFLITHIILIILSLIACWYHLVPHFGFKYGYQVWLYISFAFWSADRLARVARVAYFNRAGGAKAVVQAVPGCPGVLHATVFPRTVRGIGPGQHTFLYFAGGGGSTSSSPSFFPFWESHPFSIAAWETPGAHAVVVAAAAAAGEKTVPASPRGRDGAPSPPSFQVLIRAHAGATGALRRRLAAPARRRVEVSAYTEGYYAGHRAALRPLLAADTVLCVAGGVGITNALGFVQEYAAAAALAPEAAERGGRGGGVMRSASRFVLAWSAREMAFLEFVRGRFLAGAGVECLFWCTGGAAADDNDDDDGTAAQKWTSSKGEAREVEGRVLPAAADPAVTAGRMHVGSVIRGAVGVGRRTVVLVCGPGQMADEARRQVVRCVRDGFSVDLIEEAFTW
ncbi:putative ferric reductase like transmembrane component [Rosellinia necatrix]|uniref:Putative ferric reductase like transmembrane component n=1 Tax=Rosellinia necatrix TaxID=77044 RepID=A0A1S7UL72_ROSNE|nr:putative ferric reductase like transmembrane component [Rosellinia necatrix]